MMKKGLFFILIGCFSLFFCTESMWGQSRIPTDTSNYLQVVSLGSSGSFDRTNVVFFQVPDTETRTLYFAIRDPDGNNNDPDDSNSSINTTFSLVGGTGTISSSSSRQFQYSNGEITSEVHKTGTLLQEYVYDETFTAVSGPNVSADDEWVYFAGVSPAEGEHIGSNYYFKVVATADSSVFPNSLKNAYQLDVSSSDSFLNSVSGVYAFAYSWTIALLTSNPGDWNMYPFVPDTATGDIEFWNYDMDNEDSAAASKIDGSAPIEGSAVTVSGDSSSVGTSFTLSGGISGIDVNGTWLNTVTESSGAVAQNTTDFWHINDADGDEGGSTSGDRTTLRTYAAPYVPAQPHHVAVSFDDGTADSDGSDLERVTLQIVDSAGNSVPYIRDLYVSITEETADGSALIRYTNEYPSADQSAASLVVATDGDGLAYVEISNTSPESVIVNIETDGSGAGSSSLDDRLPSSGALGTNETASILFQAAADALPTMVSTGGLALTEGDTSSVMNDITITEDATANITAADDIYIRIPANIGAEFDTSVTAPSLAVTGTGTVAPTVTYPDSRTLLIDVTADFAGSDFLDISGLQLNATYSSPASEIAMSYAGLAGPYNVSDTQTIAVGPLTTYYWQGDDLGTPTDWGTAANWDTGFVPDSNAVSVVIPSSGVTDFPIMDTDRAVYNITIASGASLETNGSSLSVNGIMSNEGTIILDGLGAEALGAGSFDLSSGTIEYNGGGSTFVAGSSYNHLTISAGSYTLAADLDIAGDLDISGGTLNDGGNTIYVEGDWTESGTFTASGTVEFDGSGTSVLSGGTTFNNLTIDTAGRTLEFTGGETFTVNGSFYASGASGNLVRLISTSGGSQWTLGNQNVSDTAQYVAVEDSISSGTISATSSSDLGNNSGWAFSGSTYTWDGSSGSNWATPANWDLGAVPGPADTVIIPNVSNDPQLSGAVTVVSLTIQSGGVLDLNGQDLTISSTLTNVGTIVAEGGETVSAALNTDSGTIEYDGNGAYPSALPFGTDYYDIVFSGSGTWGSGSSQTINAARNLTVGDGDADAVTFSDGATLTAAGSFTLNGSLGAAGSNVLDLDAGPLSVVYNGAVLFGGSGTVQLGDVTLANGATLTLGNGAATPITASSIAGTSGGAASNLTVNTTGAVTIAGAVGTDLGTVTITDSGGTDFQSTLDTATFALTDTAGTILVQGNATITTGLTSAAAGYNVSFTGASNSVAGATAFNNTGTLTFGSTNTDSNSFIGGMTATNTSLINTAGSVLTTNSTMTMGNMNLTADTTLSSGTGSIVLNGTVDGAGALTLNTTGTTDINGVIGGTTPVASLTTNAGGTTEIGADISSDTGDQTYNDAVSLTGASTLTGTTGSSLIFNGTVDGAADLTLAIAGTTTFTANVGNTTAVGDGLGAALIVNSTGTTEFQQIVKTASGISQGNAAGEITFRKDVTTGAGDTASAFNADVVLEDGLIFYPQGAVAFGNAAGDSLTIPATAPVTIDSSSSNAAVTFDASVALNNAFTVTAGSGAITFNGPTDGAYALILNTTGTTAINGAIGGTTPVGSLTTNTGGTTEIGADISSDTGNQTYNDAVSITGTSTLTGTTGSNLNFNSTVDGANDLTLDIIGTTTFVGNVGSTTPIGDGMGAALTVNSTGTTEFQGTVDTGSGIRQKNTAGDITFRNNVTAGAGDTTSIFTANVILDGLTFDAFNALTFGSAGADTLTINTSSVTIDSNDNDLTINAGIAGDGQDFSVDAGTADFYQQSTVVVNALQSYSIVANNAQLTSIGTSGAGNPGVTTYLDVTTTNLITLDGQYYSSGTYQSYNSGSNGTRIELVGNGEFRASAITFGDTLVPGTNNIGDVYLDFTGRILDLYADITCGMFAFFNGTVNLNGNDISTSNNQGRDFVVMGASYSADDADWSGGDTRFEYPDSSGLAWAPLGPYSAAFGVLDGSTITVGTGGTGNFYINGTDLSASANWTLNLQSNANASLSTAQKANFTAGSTDWGDHYNIAFNMGVAYSQVTGGSISAAEPDAGPPAETNNNVVDNGNNIVYNPVGPVPGWDFTRPDISTVETVWDNVVKIVFTEEIENSNYEISQILATTGFLGLSGDGTTGDSTAGIITNVYKTFDDVTGIGSDPITSTTGAGDTDTIYVEVTGSWNTDATGTSIGNADTFSSDSNGDHKTTYPDLAIMKSVLFDTGGRNPIRNYGNNGFGIENSATDGAGPVLVGVKAGTASYNGTPASDYSNGHNYFIFRFSEQMDFQTSGTVLGTGNIASNSNTRVGDYGVDSSGILGHIKDQDVSGTISVEGLMEYTGVFHSGYIPDFSGEPNPDYINTIERTNEYEVLIDIAAYYYTINSEWAGYLGKTGVTLTTPHSLAFTGVNDSHVLDLNGNQVAVSTGRTINQDMGFAAGSDWNAISETGWDVDPPVISQYSIIAGRYEVIPRDTTINGVLDRFEFHVLDDSSDFAGWDSSSDHIDPKKGIRDSSIQNINAFYFEEYGISPLTNAYNLTYATDVDNSVFDVNPINTVDDPYFAIDVQDSGHAWDTLTKIWTEYDEDTGFLTDLAGNRLRTYVSFRAVESVPPSISLALAVPGNDWGYVKFTEDVYGDAVASISIDAADFVLNGASVSVSSVSSWPGGTANQEFRFTFSGALSENDIVDGHIKAVNATSVYDVEGNAFQDSLTHRISDLGFNIVEPIWASDGIHSDDIREGTSLTEFDGTGKLMDRDILLQARINATSAQSSSMLLYFDGNVDDSYVTNNLWLPYYHEELAPVGNYSSRYVNASSILGNGLQEFIIPSTDEDMETDNTMEFLFMIGDLPCVYLENANDITSYKPWSFQIKDIRKQKGGVTILNNIINPLDGEEAILIYEVDDPGVVTVQVFALNGSMVRILHRGRQAEGTYQYLWDGRNNGGRVVARGVYFIRVVGPEIDEIRKVLVVK